MDQWRNGNFFENFRNNDGHYHSIEQQPTVSKLQSLVVKYIVKCEGGNPHIKFAHFVNSIQNTENIYQHLEKGVNFSCVIQKNEKFAGSYFSHFTTFHNNTKLCKFINFSCHFRLFIGKMNSCLVQLLPKYKVQF
jgi:hypothetical protein